MFIYSNNKSFTQRDASLTIDHWHWKLRLPLVLLLLFFLSSCAGPQEHLWLHAPDWGLAKIVTTTHLDQPVEMAQDENGRLYLFTLSPDLRPTIVALDEQANLRWQTSLPDSFPELTVPRLFWQNGELFLFWQHETTASAGVSQAVYAAALRDDGTVTAPAAPLIEQPNLASYDVALAPNGEIALWWGGTRRLPGVWAARISSLSQTAVFTSMAADGLQPAIQFDANGTLHASWHELQLLGQSTVTHFYTTLPSGDPETAVSPTQLAEEPLRSGSLIQGPFLTILAELEQVNIVWTEVLRSGRGAGGGRTVTLSFPSGQPEGASLTFVRLPALGQPYSAAPEDGLQVGQRILLSERDAEFGLSPAQLTFADQNAPEMAFALPQRQPQGRLLISQVALGYLQNGQVTGAQLLTQTDTASFRPSLHITPENELHVTWLRRAEPEGFAVYLASSEPQLQTALSQLSRLDYQRMAAETVTSILQGVVFTPFAFLVWMLVPMLLFLVTIPLRRGARTLQERPIQLSIWLGLISYLVVKLATMRGLWGYQPFSATIPIMPSWLGLPLQIIIPLASLWLAWRAAQRLTERSETESAVFFVAMFVAVDSLITMTFFGDTLLGLL